MKVKVGMTEHWREAWKWGTIYMYAILAVLPDIWNLVVASGLLEASAIGDQLDRIIKIYALLGAIVRLVKVQVDLQRGKSASDAA